MQIDYNLIVGIAGIIIGAISTWWSISHSRRIAIESGALKKVAPSIYFFKKNIFRNPIESTNWILLCPKDAELTVYSLSFQVANEGDATLDSPVLTVQGSIDCIKDVPDNIFKHECIPGVMKESVKRSIVNLGNFNQISYLLPYIVNNSAVEITDFFCFINTVNIPAKGDVPLSDGTIAKYTVAYSFSYILSIGLLTKGYQPVKCDLKMMCLPADSIDEAKDILARVISKKTSHRKEYYAFLQFAIDQKVKYNDKYNYFMKTYREKGFNMKVFGM